MSMIVPLIQHKRYEAWERCLPHLVTQQLIRDRPYMQGWFRRVDPVVTTAIPSIAVSLRPDGRVECLINMEWFSTHSSEEQRGLLAHELFHLVGEHLTRGLGRDPRRWGYGTDMAINPSIPSLPACPALDGSRGLRPSLYAWPDGLSSEEYDELFYRRYLTMQRQDSRRHAEEAWCDHRVKVTDPSGRIIVRRDLSAVMRDLYGVNWRRARELGRFAKARPLRERYVYPPGVPSGGGGSGADPLGASGKEKGDTSPVGSGGTVSPAKRVGSGDEHPDPRTADDHRPWWSSSHQDGDREGAECYAEVGRQVADELAEMIAEAIESQDASSYYRGAGYGTLPGEVVEKVRAVRDRWKLNWRQLVQGVGVPSNAQSYLPRWNKLKVNKRLKVRPGIVLRPKGKVFVGSDTSGSMTSGVLEAVRGEIQKLARHATVVVGECDTALRQVYRYKGTFPPMQGRGGTNFNPFFEFVYKTRRVGWERMIVFTDGYGPVDARWGRRIRIPVLWVITPGGSFRPPFGRAITITDVR